MRNCDEERVRLHGRQARTDGQTLFGQDCITIRIDNDVLAWFRERVDRAGGGNYQTLINDALWQHMSAKQEALEVTLRRIIREEIKKANAALQLAGHFHPCHWTSLPLDTA
jgi:uncharacterized protein (DUF4415 family)